MKLTKRSYWFGGAIIAVMAITAATFIIARSDKPPVAGITKVKSGLQQAREMQAARYAPEEMDQAEAEWQKILARWREENRKWPWQRDFSDIEQLVGKALRMAEAATARSLAKRSEMQQKLRGVLENLTGSVRKFKVIYSNIPVPLQIKQNFARGELLLSEGRLAFERGEYDSAEIKLHESHKIIQGILSATRSRLKTYLASLPEWRRWAAETVAWSKRSGESAIIVDKMVQTCRLYQGGQVKGEYPIEMGANWIGDKNNQGDQMTPEGRYKIIAKKSGNQTRYYKALLINYPNDLDRQRFARAKAQGIIPAKAGIGGAIEIHGGGGRGANWTDGCIALSNIDMDFLFPLVAENTPVIIVGSLRSFEEILSEFTNRKP